MELAVQIAAGIGLASCAGLRAFLPLFVVGASARFGWVRLAEPFTWLDSDAALVLLGTAVAAEILADKLPVVDHFLDAIGVFVKPVAGMLVMASTLSATSPLAATVLALILGMPVAAGVHLIKAKTRIVSTVSTMGLANPVQSVVEDVASLAGCVLCVLLPIVALGIILLLIAVLWTRRRGPSAA
jgi:hypothetical protein